VKGTSRQNHARGAAAPDYASTVRFPTGFHELGSADSPVACSGQLAGAGSRRDKAPFAMPPPTSTDTSRGHRQLPPPSVSPATATEDQYDHHDDQDYEPDTHLTSPSFSSCDRTQALVASSCCFVS